MAVAAGSTNEVRVARSAEELERLRDEWQSLPWPRVEADIDFFLTTLGDAAEPLGALVTRDGEPVAGSVARLERSALATKVGYRTVYEPTLRTLSIPYHAVVAQELPDAMALVGELYGTTARGEADVVSLL